MIKVNFQQLSKFISDLPSKNLFRQWIKASLAPEIKNGEICMRFVDETEMAGLNQNFRKKSGPTNILSFPPPSSQEFDPDHLGDLVVCVPVVLQEAAAQHKSIVNHFAHLTVHGVLHLQGYDHIAEEDAIVMEDLEITILKALNIPNPYLILERSNES